MRALRKLILVLIISTSCNSQEMLIVQQQAVKSTTGNRPVVDNNLQGEKDYFSAYLLPLSQKASIQTALDTYRSVRLEEGDYSGVNISMKSGYRIYGHPAFSRVSNILIEDGSSSISLSNLYMLNSTITFEAGLPITNCTFNTIKWAAITAVDARIENNLFLNVLSQINFNCSNTGYIRNNRIYKHQVHGTSPALVLKGNDTTPSYGNVSVFSNYLTQSNIAADIDKIAGINFIGLDSEGWNLSSSVTTKSMFNAINSGDIKITDFGGSNGYAPGFEIPAFDIQAQKVFFLNKGISNAVANTNPSKLRANTNSFLVYGLDDDKYTVEGTGFDFRAHYEDDSQTIYTNNSAYYNAVLQNSLITSNPAVTNLTSFILDTPQTPISRPVFETLPDPLGVNWKTDRIGKTDSRNYIQNLINTVGIANLPAGVFYIGSTLNMAVDGTKGITGAGTGKTVIVGLTDDFPLITLSESASGDNDFTLSFLTLQGGSVGVYAPDEMDLIAFSNFSYVTFREQNYGIQLHKIFGLDNCYFDHINFVGCNIGVFQDPDPVYTIENSGYIDKALFYQSQFINCGKGFSFLATRANNLNVWIDCNFSDNDLAVLMSGNNYSILANCDFKNNHGEYTIDGEMSLYNCNFADNTVSNSTFKSKNMFIEGCNFLDSSRMFVNSIHYNTNFYILNSTVTGDVTKSYGMMNALYMNSKLLANPTLSKLLVNIKNNSPLVLLDAVPNPYPQLLVTH